MSKKPGQAHIGPRGFNVPWGRYAAPSWSDVRLRAAAAALRGCELVAASFDAVLRVARSGDFVYLDPPYDGTFSSYTADGFGEGDQHRLAEVFAELARRGCHVLLSNADTTLVRRLYRGFHTETVMARRQINRDPAGRRQVGELLVMSELHSPRSGAAGAREAA